MTAPLQTLQTILQVNQGDVLKTWLAEMEKSQSQKMKMGELTEESREFLSLFTTAVQSGVLNTQSETWGSVRAFLTNVSRTRGLLGYSPTETAMFVFSLKSPLYEFLRQSLKDKPTELADTVWEANTLLDRLGLYTTEVYQKAREEVILRQQEEMLELSTPVVKLWDGVLALPLIGTLDSSRTQVVMESLLQKIVETNSETAIIDITGVPTVDTLVAQHLIKTVTAARLMGADCIISGIRPQIAATIVHLGVDLGNVITKSTLADAFRLALSRLNRHVVSTKAVAKPRTVAE